MIPGVNPPDHAKNGHTLDKSLGNVDGRHVNFYPVEINSSGDAVGRTGPTGSSSNVFYLNGQVVSTPNIPATDGFITLNSAMRTHHKPDGTQELVKCPEIIGGDQNGLLWYQQNPDTGVYERFKLASLIASNSEWSSFSFSAIGYFGSSLLNDTDAMIGTATYSGNNAAISAGSHAVMLLPMQLSSDLNNDGKIDDSDVGVKSAGQSASATAAQKEAATEYIFVNDNLSNGQWDKDDPDPNKPTGVTDDDDAEQIKTTCGATWGAVWFEHPVLGSIRFYKTAACKSSDQITFPFLLSPTNPLPSTMYIRLEGQSLPYEADGDLVMKFGSADKSQVWAQDKLSLSVITKLGDPKFFQAARNYILERNTKLFVWNWHPPSEVAASFRVCTMLEEKASIVPFETYYSPSASSPLSSKNAGLDKVIAANPSATVVVNGNQCAFSNGLTEHDLKYTWKVAYLIDVQVGAVTSLMTDKCLGRLVANGTISTASLDNNSLDTTGTYYSGTTQSVSDVGGPDAKYVAWNGSGTIQFVRGRVPDAPPLEALGGLVTDYSSAHRQGISNQMVGRWASPTKPGQGVIFTASAPDGVTDGPSNYGHVPEFVAAATSSGVKPLANPSRPTDMEIFMLDSGQYAVGLARVSPDGTLRADIAEWKMHGNPFYVNTYLTFLTTTPR